MERSRTPLRLFRKVEYVYWCAPEAARRHDPRVPWYTQLGALVRMGFLNHNGKPGGDGGDSFHEVCTRRFFFVCTCSQYESAPPGPHDVFQRRTYLRGSLRRSTVYSKYYYDHGEYNRQLHFASCAWCLSESNTRNPLHEGVLVLTVCSDM